MCGYCSKPLEKKAGAVTTYIKGGEYHPPCADHVRTKRTSMKVLPILLLLLLPVRVWTAEDVAVPEFLRQLATAIETVGELKTEMGTLTEQVSELSSQESPAPKESLKEYAEKTGQVPINHPEIEGEDWLTRYNNAVWFILNTWGFDKWENLHVTPEVFPTLQEKYRTPQAHLPSIFFPPGNYDFKGTIWLFPNIELVGAGHWQTRFWFWDGVYEDDRGWWRDEWKDLKGGPVTMLPVCIGVPTVIQIKVPGTEEVQHWGSFSHTLRNITIKANVPKGQVIVGLYGALTNPRFERLHLMADTRRDLSVAINHVPQSTPRELPWGVMPPYGNEATGYQTHILDGTFDDIMIEYCRYGIVLTGMGFHIDGLRIYYAQKGLHIYGNGLGKNEFYVNMTMNKHGNKLWPENAVAAIFAHYKIKEGTYRVISDYPVWEGLSLAPETRGGFRQGQGLW